MIVNKLEQVWIDDVSEYPIADFKEIRIDFTEDLHFAIRIIEGEDILEFACRLMDMSRTIIEKHNS